MRLPKKILINFRYWTVTQDKQSSGADFEYKDGNINIGVRDNTDREILTHLIHEVGEISCVERGVRAQKSMMSNESNDYVFVASHARFSDVMSDISVIVGDLMKLDR